LLVWLRGHGELGRVGVEGTGAYGAALSRQLRAAGIAVMEVDRPNCQTRAAVGKSDR
jgi:transposase